MVQCKCKTDDGSRCKRSANTESSHGFCHQHNKPVHSKMRCISLARPGIGYKSPAKRPSSPRPLKSKSAKKTTKSRSKSAKKTTKKSKSRSKSAKKTTKKSKSRSKSATKMTKKSKSATKMTKSATKMTKKSKSHSKSAAKKTTKKSPKSRSKNLAKKTKSHSKKSRKSRSKKLHSKKRGLKYRMNGGAAAAAAGITVTVKNLAGGEINYDLPAGAKVSDLIRDVCDGNNLKLGDAGSAPREQNIRIMDNSNGIGLVSGDDLNNGAEYTALYVSYPPGSLLRIYGPAQNQVQYFNPPNENGESTPMA